MHLPSLRQLQYLAAVAEYGNFSRAAEACHVTQSTLSAGIGALESLLNHMLVDRSQNPVSLTPFGSEVVLRAHGMLAAARTLMERAQHLSAPLTGPLRIGIIPTIAPYLLPFVLPDLQKKYPALELQLHEDLSARLVESARRGDIDLILMAFPFETPGMEQVKLFEEPFFLACPKGLWEKAPPVDLTDLREANNLILLEEGHCLRDHALAACKLQPAQQRQTFSATSLPTLIQMVQHGYGITLLPAMAWLAGHLPDKIDVFPFLNPPPKRIIGMAWREGSPRAEEYRQLAKTIGETYLRKIQAKSGKI